MYRYNVFENFKRLLIGICLAVLLLGCNESANNNSKAEKNKEKIDSFLDRYNFI